MKLPTDWVFRDQWHLRNRVSGEFDIDVVGVWSPPEGPGYTGDGVRAVVIDDGFDYDHPDLRVNYNRRRDADYALGTDDPFGNRKNEHGHRGALGLDTKGVATGRGDKGDNEQDGPAVVEGAPGIRLHGPVQDPLLGEPTDQQRGDDLGRGATAQRAGQRQEAAVAARGLPRAWRPGAATRPGGAGRRGAGAGARLAGGAARRPAAAGLRHRGASGGAGGAGGAGRGTRRRDRRAGARRARRRRPRAGKRAALWWLAARPRAR